MDFTKTVRWGKFLRELRAAVPSLTVPANPRTAPAPSLYVDTDDVRGRVFLVPPPGAPPSVLAAITSAVNAHDPTTPDAFETMDNADQSDLDAFPTRAQVTNALGQITTDLTTLSGTPTNAQVVSILNRTITNQRAIIRALNVLVHRGQ